MSRDPGRNQLRENIAHLAARLMAEDDIEDYAQAKRKAARQAGASDTRQMPNNDEIDAALRLYREIYRHDYSAQLRKLRRLALDIMLELAVFNPYLTGSVLRGSAGKYADIHLQLFNDNSKGVEHYLLGRNIHFRSREARLYAGDMFLVAPVLIFDRDGYEVHLTLLSPRELRAQIRSSVEGKPIERVKPAAVAALLEEN